MAKLQRLAAALRYWRQLRRIFDAEFYLRRYPDVAAGGGGPLRHYLEYGASEGRKPHPLFDHDYYVLCCPEARRGSEPSIFHFLKSPVPAGNPHPLFDCESYLRAHPDSARRRINPLLHYVGNSKPRREPALPSRSRASAAALQPSCEGAVFQASDCCAFLEVMDVPVRIVLGEGDDGVGGDVVRVWEDASGRMQFLAPPEQEPFFAAMKYDQLQAQTEGRRAK